MKRIKFYLNVAASVMLAFTLAASMQSCVNEDVPTIDPEPEPEPEPEVVIANADDFLAAVDAAQDGDTIEVAPGAVIILNEALNLKDKSLVFLTDATKPAILAPSSEGIITNTSVSIQNFIIEAADLVKNDGLINLMAAEAVTNIDSIALINVNVKNLHNALLQGANNNVIKEVIVENSIVAITAADSKFRLFNFQTKGLPELLTINNSTIWADAATVPTNGNFYSTQSGQKMSELGISQNVISITNSTLYNIAYGKPVSTLRENSQAGQQYIVKNSVIVDCGQAGQFYRGLNGRQAGKVANWDIDGNVVNFDGKMYVESVAGSEDNVLNPIYVVVEFADAANGNFNQVNTTAGDPRWVK